MLGLVQTSCRCGGRTREEADRGIKGIFGEVMACLAWYRLHTAVVGGPEWINDRGIKGIFGEVMACLAWYRLHAGGIVAPLVILIKFKSYLQ